MKRRGPCVHQQTLQASASGPAASSSASSAQPPAPKRNVAAAACLRLYAEGQELLDHKRLLYAKFGLQKAPVMRTTMGSTATTARGSRNPETSATAKLTAKPGVNQASKATTAAATERASVQGTGSNHGGLTAAASPTKERRSSTVYVSPGGRSPTATTTTIKQVFAKTYSLQSTAESRAAVAPRRKSGSTNRNSPSPRGGAARNDHGGVGSMRVAARHDAPTSANSTTNAAKCGRVSTASASLGRGKTPQLVHSQPSQQQPSGFQLTQVSSRTSITPGSLDITIARGSRASMVSPRSAAIVGRRPSAAPIQQKTRTFSTIFQQQQQQQQQQQRQEPVLVQVSRRTSSPIMSPVGPGGRRRPSVAPIGPASPVRGIGGGSDAGSSIVAPGSGCSPRTSFTRRENKLEKLQEQVNVLKASLGISEEDLQWKVESSKGNAFLAADRHLTACEERYDRLVFEMQVLSQPARCVDEDKANVALAAKLRSLEKQAQQVGELKARAITYQTDMVQTKKHLLAVRVEAELQRAKQNSSAATSAAEQELATSRRLESIKEEILIVQQQLKTEQSVLQTLLEWLGSETDRFGASVAAEDLSPSPVISEQTVEAKRSLLYTLRTIPECTQGSERLSILCSQATQLAAKITASRAHDLKHTEMELERTMRDVEIWKTRRGQAKEFADEMRKREAAWQAKQREKNDECLALLRTFIPIDIADLSVEAIITRAQEETNGAGSGVLYTYDLAAYLKTNRFLHWLVTHEDDIARANFLAIESASFFMDFASYDIHELRALARVLPDSFAFDKDGRKNAWRSSFIDHVRQLAAQQQHETIKAGWDHVKRARQDIPLPELTARQQLNSIFCYPTDAEIAARLVKFERQYARLEAKRARLRKLDDELIPQAKAEYVAVAEDARNEDLQRSFGKATLIALREEAKQQHLALCKERDSAKGELAHGKRAWSAMTPSFEQYQAEVAQIRALDPEIRNAPRIRGPFPAEIDVQPRERATFKKLSVEEEAEARKQELDNAIAKRSHDIQEVVIVEVITAAPTPAEQVTKPAVVEVSPLTEAESETMRLMQLEDKQSTVATEPGAVSDTPLETAPAPVSRGFKRVKSLQVAVGVLQFLEKDFCSPTRVMRGKEGGLLSPTHRAAASKKPEIPEKSDKQVVRTPRGSRSLPSTPKAISKATKDEDTKVVKTPVVVQPKSKALLKLVEARKAEETGNSPNSDGSSARVPPPSPFGGGKTNFLDELKRKAGGAGASSAATPKKSMNFLDELKSASARKDSVGTEDTANASSPQVPAVLASGDSTAAAPSTPRNFLDELKTRARTTS
ncbi:hypothetical protein PHYPSEUDO_003237 [Phytophthora pseudosyringae]|uniref:Uncharacterized protein n=1 Tax=Phytophthora pseudosyringae TaxID=221518 RepID=A0A8T1VVC3_9STRA|nr:hypothetical protein PHYPSEUDO_003237 [Phytophthora pseudosyringae]